MRERAQEARRDSAREARVGVERQHVAHAEEGGRVALVDHEGGVARAREQAVELLELPALSLPAHPATLGGAPAARTVEEVEGTAAVLAMAPVELADPGDGLGDDLPIARPICLRGVREVGQEREAERRVRVGEVVDLEPAHERGRVLDARQERRDDDRGARVGGDPAVERHLGKHVRREEARHERVHERHRERERGSDGERQADREHGGFGAQRREIEEGHRERPGRREHGRDRVRRPGTGEDGPTEPFARGRSIPDGALEEASSFVDQPVADVGVPLAPGRCLPRVPDRASGDLDLGVARTSREVLDRAAVAVGGLEVHPRVGTHGILGEDGLEDAPLAHERLPPDRGDRAEAADRPGDAFRRVEARLAGPVGRLGEGQGEADDLGDRLHQGLEEREPQQRRQRPQLAEVEGHRLLVGVHEARERLRVRLEVAGAEEPVDHPVRPRGPGERADGERGQAAVEAGREVLANLSHGTLDEVGVVEEPLGELRPGRLGLEEALPRAMEPVREAAQGRVGREGLGRLLRDRVAGRERACSRLDRGRPRIRGRRHASPGRSQSRRRGACLREASGQGSSRTRSSGTDVRTER
jgi:hypothetical protein